MAIGRASRKCVAAAEELEDAAQGGPGDVQKAVRKNIVRGTAEVSSVLVLVVRSLFCSGLVLCLTWAGTGR